MKKSILLIITLFMVTRVFAQNAYSPEMLKAFADDLYVQGFWDEAESEYKRYFFAVNNAAIDDNSVLNLSHIYFQEKNKTGIEWINSNLKRSCGFAVQSRLEYIDASFMFIPPLPIASETSSGRRNTSAFFSSSSIRIEEIFAGDSAR